MKTVIYTFDGRPPLARHRIHRHDGLALVSVEQELPHHRLLTEPDKETLEAIWRMGGLGAVKDLAQRGWLAEMGWSLIAFQRGTWALQPPWILGGRVSFSDTRGISEGFVDHYPHRGFRR